MGAINPGTCASYRSECQQGIHSSSDTYMMALIAVSPSGTIDPSTFTNYSQLGANEVSGSGYTPGGVQMSGFNATVQGGVACLDFTSPVVFPTCTVSAIGALVYNASKGNRAVSLHTFGGTISSTNANFDVNLPGSGPTSSLIRC